MASRAPVRLPPSVERLLALVHIDWEPPNRQPSAARVVLATVLSVVGSLVADAVLVAVGTRVFPSTRGFVHFRFSDYGSLTVVGVLVACLAWPIVTRITSTPRWLFFRLAVLVTVVLWIPDIWILLHGEPAKAVAVLMAMHLAIALVTYNALVYLAPAGRRRAPLRDDDTDTTAASSGGRPSPGRSTLVARTTVDGYPGGGRAMAEPSVRLTGATAAPMRTETSYPAADAARPEVTVARPEVTVARPEVTVARPEVTVARPEVTAARPEVTVARGRGAHVARPETDAPGSEERVPLRQVNNVARPPASLAEPRSAVRVLPAHPRPAAASPSSPPPAPGTPPVED